VIQGIFALSQVGKIADFVDTVNENQLPSIYTIGRLRTDVLQYRRIQRQMLSLEERKAGEASLVTLAADIEEGWKIYQPMITQDDPNEVKAAADFRKQWDAFLARAPEFLNAIHADNIERATVILTETRGLVDSVDDALVRDQNANQKQAKDLNEESD